MKRSAARTTGMLAVSILIAVFAVAPVAIAAGDVYVCKVVGHPGAYHLQGGDNPINVSVHALGSDVNPVVGAPFDDAHPSFVIASDDRALCEAGLPPTHVDPPTFTAGCLAAGTVDAPETDAYTWDVTGTEDAMVYTAEAESGYTLALPKSWTYDLSPIPYQSTDQNGACYSPPDVTDPPLTHVDPPTFTAGCLAAGTVDAPETDAYTWDVTGTEDAMVYTAEAESGYTLALPKSWTYDLSPIPYQSTDQNGDCYVDPVVPVVPTVPGDPPVQQKITLKAKVVNDAGGTAKVSDFTLTGSSTQVASASVMQNSAAMAASAATTSFSGVTGAAAITNADVPVGTYFLSESELPSGYSASAWACTGGQLNGSAITVAHGKTVECLITNSYSSTVVDSPGVPKGHPASPPAAVLAVDKAAPGAKAPTAVTPTAVTPTAVTPTVTTPTAVTPSAAIPAAATLAFTGAEPVPLSLLALFALVLGVALTVAGRRQGGQGTRG